MNSLDDIRVDIANIGHEICHLAATVCHLLVHIMISENLVD
jgi:hypothetical protein